MTTTHTKARIKDASHRSWPVHVRELPVKNIGELILDVFSDGVHTYVVFPWNSAQDAENSRGWRADRHGQHLWSMIKSEAGDTPSALNEWRYRGAWFVGEPAELLDPIVGSGPVSGAAPEGFISLAEHVKAIADLKATVARVTAEYTAEHGWCHEAQNALRDMGIDPEPTKYNVTLRIDLVVCVRAEDDDDAEEKAQALLPDYIPLKQADADGDTQRPWEHYDTVETETV